MADFQFPPIVERHYEFCNWMVLKISKFPRDQRYMLGSRIGQISLGILEELIAAAMQRGTDKQKVLQELNIRLEQLRFLLRMAKDARLMNEKSHHYASGLLLETGKSLGGWIKQAKT